MQDVAVQVTPLSSLACAPGGTEAGWTLHFAPSHCSTNTCEFAVPTAVQVSAAVQSTAKSLLAVDPVGLGVGWMCHVLPFHRSARVRSVPELAADCPTPVHAEADEHETP